MSAHSVLMKIQYLLAEELHDYDGKQASSILHVRVPYSKQCLASAKFRMRRETAACRQLLFFFEASALNLVVCDPCEWPGMVLPKKSDMHMARLTQL